MAETLPLDELEKYATNVYEAIVMIAIRARQINELQKQILDNEAEAISQTEEFDEDGVNADIIEHKFLRLPKPTTIALNEYLEGKLDKIVIEKEG